MRFVEDVIVPVIIGIFGLLMLLFLVGLVGSLVTEIACRPLPGSSCVVCSDFGMESVRCPGVATKE